MQFKGYKLDPFQEQALEVLHRGESVIVAAPTGAGKTLIAEYAVELALAAGKRVIYTAPIKALGNQKFRDFSADYPGQVGLVTGDVTLNREAPVLIMTTEIFRNTIFDDPLRLEDVSHVIFDEVHYLDDFERGTVWEEAIIFAPQHLRFLCLSATIPNLEALAQWMGQVREVPVRTVEEHTRPVPLQHKFCVDGRIYDGLKGWKPRKRSRGRPPRGRPAKQPDPLLEHLDRRNLLPCLYFAFSRNRCEELAWRHRKMHLLDKEGRRTILALFDDLAARYGIPPTPRLERIRSLVSRGVAFHHAGMLPSMKEVVERLFTSGLLRLIFTTETFALGVNMPARTVVFDQLTKFDGTEFTDLTCRSYQQMAGRAGRRGIDKQGLVFSRIESRFMNPHRVKRIVFGRPEAVHSQFNSCYATILNLWSLLGDRIFSAYQESFHFFGAPVRETVHAQHQIERKLGVLSALGCIEADLLTLKGRFAAKLYGQELASAEFLFGGLLDDLDEIDLAVLAMAVVFEQRGRVGMTKADKDAAAVVYRPATGIVGHIHRLEQRHGVRDGTQPLDFRFSACVRAWAEGCSFADLVEWANRDEGEVVRHLRRAVQLLRQMHSAAVGWQALQQRMRRTIELLNRDVVDAEKQIRAGEGGETFLAGEAADE